MRLLVIYDHPRDLPGGFVVRGATIMAGVVQMDADPLGVDLPTLAAARALIPAGFVLVQRNHDDDPVIVETWV